MVLLGMAQNKQHASEKIMQKIMREIMQKIMQKTTSSMTHPHCITNRYQPSRFLLLLSSLLLVFVLAGCRVEQNEPLVVVPQATQPPPTAKPVASPTQASGSKITPTPAITYKIEPTEPLTATEASAPTRLQIPAVGIDVAVSSMGWQAADVNGVATTVWILPDVGVGWHPNSALAGSVGTVVISGHQLLGAASFAPLALGDVTTGQDILLTDSITQTFVYRVTAVSDPQPISTDNVAELALAAQYTAQNNDTTDAILTIITGWPDFSSTHRLFVTAEFVGMVE